MRFLIYVNLSLYVVALFSCAPQFHSKAESVQIERSWSYFELKGYTTPKSLTVLSREQVSEDISLLIYALERAYGGRTKITADAMAEIKMRLKAIDTKDVSALCRTIADIVYPIPDNHLRFRLEETWCDSHLRKQEDWPHKNLNTSDKPWMGYRASEGIYVLAISRFAPGPWPGFEAFVHTVLTEADMLILDLRGNSGGDDSTGLKLAEMLAEQPIETPFISAIHSQTPETLVIWENRLKALLETLDNEGARATVQGYLDQNSVLLNRALAGQLPEFSSAENPPGDWKYDDSKGFRGTIAILQDGRCRSSCESSINFFDDFPNVLRVGSATAGTIQFGNVGLFYLPNSGIRVSMPTKENRYRDGRFIERKGIPPHIRLSPEENAYAVILDIAKGASSSCHTASDCSDETDCLRFMPAILAKQSQDKGLHWSTDIGLCVSR